jgi:hypothetical protein
MVPRTSDAGSELPWIVANNPVIKAPGSYY